MLPTEDARWAEARRIVDGLPSEALEARVRRGHRLVVLLVVGVLLLAVAIAFALAAWAGDEPSATEDEPLWREIAALVLAGSAVVLVAGGAIGQWRAARRLGGLRSPLTVLDRQQQKPLLHELRGSVPVESAHVPLVQHLAGRLAGQRWLLVLQFGLLVMFVGQWIAEPETWRLVAVVTLGVVLLAAAVFTGRDVRRARRFLAEHPRQRAG